MTATEWHDRAEACRLAGDRLVIDPDEYASLVRLKLCSDPGNPLHHDLDLFGVPLVVQ